MEGYTYKLLNAFARNLNETAVEEDTIKEVFTSFLKDYKCSLNLKNSILKYETNAVEESKKLLNVLKKFPVANLEKYLFKLRKNEKLTSEYLSLLIKNCKTFEESEYIRQFLLNKIMGSDHLVLFISALLELVIIEVDMITEEFLFPYTHQQFAKNLFSMTFFIQNNVLCKLNKKEDLKKVSHVTSSILSILIEFKLKFHSKFQKFEFLKDVQLICGFDKSLMLDCIAQVELDYLNKATCLKEMKDLYKKVLIETEWKEQSADLFVKICLAAKKVVEIFQVFSSFIL